MTLATNCGSVDSLNPSCGWGLRSNFFQIRPIVDLLSPARLAIDARDQWVASFGVSSRVATTTSSTWSSRIEAGRPGRGSSSRPSNPRAANRDRHRFTAVTLTAKSAETCLFAAPSAQASTIRARIARYCAVWARRAHRVSCARSSSVSTSSAFGRPARCSSSSPTRRCLANRERHLPTVATLTESRRATAAFGRPSAHASTIRTRSANRPPSPATGSNARRSAADNTICTACGPGCDTTTL